MSIFAKGTAGPPPPASTSPTYSHPPADLAPSTCGARPVADPKTAHLEAPLPDPQLEEIRRIAAVSAASIDSLSKKCVDPNVPESARNLYYASLLKHAECASVANTYLASLAPPPAPKPRISYSPLTPPLSPPVRSLRKEAKPPLHPRVKALKTPSPAVGLKRSSREGRAAVDPKCDFDIDGDLDAFWNDLVWVK